MKIEINVPKNLHPKTRALVAAFAEAMADKLRRAELKHDFTDGWSEPDWQGMCREEMIAHLLKGDPVDVANYCAFMWFHGWRTGASAVVVA